MICSKLRFSKFEKFASSLSSKILLNFLLQLKSDVWEQNCVWLFDCFYYEGNDEVLKSKSTYILLNKNINFNKDETELRMENATHSFKKTKLVLQLI